MNVFDPNQFSLQSLYVCSLYDRQKTRIGESTKIPKEQQEIIFETICEGLLETNNMNVEFYIETLKSINKFTVEYEIPDSKYSEAFAKIIIDLLQKDVIEIVKCALLVVSNLFSQEKVNQIEIHLLNEKIVGILHALFIKWETCVFIEILYAISNIVAISKECRDQILIFFRPIELEALISSTVTHEKLKNRCKALLKKLCYYKLNYENALSVFEMLVNIKKYTGNWIFEQMGYCVRWINKDIEINPSLISEALDLLLSNGDEDIRSALIFIGYSAAIVNERIVQLLSDEREDISALAIWSIINFIHSKGRQSIQICFDFNILQIIQLFFQSGSYKQRIESAFCLCDIIQYATVTEINFIISLGLCTELVEIFVNCTNQELLLSIVNTFILLLSLQRNGQISETIRQVEYELYDTAVDTENSNCIELSRASTKLLNILEQI